MYELVQQQTFEFSLISHQEHIHLTCAVQAEWLQLHLK